MTIIADLLDRVGAFALRVKRERAAMAGQDLAGEAIAPRRSGDPAERSGLLGMALVHVKIDIEAVGGKVAAGFGQVKGCEGGQEIGRREQIGELLRGEGGSRPADDGGGETAGEDRTT